MIGARAAFVLAVLVLGSACSPGSSSVDPSGVVPPATYALSGHLVGIGGPAGAPTQHWAGTIHVAGMVQMEVGTDAHGGFRVHLPPGRYTLTGHSPQYDDGDGACQAVRAVVVRPDAHAHVRVICVLM